MASKAQGVEIKNKILARLSSADYRLLEPNLTTMDLPYRKMLEARNRRTDYVYFIHSGIASMVAGGQTLQSTEIGMIGREGMSGVSILLSAERSPHETYMHIGGNGSRIGVSHLRAAMDASPSLRRTLLRYAYAFLTQVGYTALSNRHSKLEERLARWLLMAQDRSTGNNLILTHELIAFMLGVRRAGITTALSLLEARGLVNPKRGAISISDREGLKRAANGAYGRPEAEFNRLFG